MKILNYLFYRIHLHYSKEKDNSFPIFTAAIYITVIEILFLFFIFLSINAIFYNDRLIAKEFFSSIGINNTGIKIFAIITYVIMHLLNYFFYKNKIQIIETEYKKHRYNQWFKLWMLYLIGFIFISVPILIFKLQS